MTIFKVLSELLVKGRELCVYKILTQQTLWNYARTSTGVFLPCIFHLKFFIQLFFLFTLLYYQVDWNNLLKFLSLFNWIHFLDFGNCLVSKQSLGHLIFVTSDSSSWAPKMGCFQRSAGVHRVTAEHLGTSSSSSWENFFLQESAAVKMCLSRPDQLTCFFCKVVVQVLMLPVHVLFCGVSFDIYFFRA